MSDIFKKNIKEWISLDNELKLLNEQVKKLRDKRNKIHNDIIMYVETNELGNPTVKLSDGIFKFYNPAVLLATQKLIQHNGLSF